MTTEQSNIKSAIDGFFAEYSVKKFPKGHILVYPGDAIDHVFYLLSGSVAKYDISPAGNEVIVNVFKPQAFFPMSAAVNKTANDYFFEAVEPIEVRMAPAKQAVKFVQDNPDVMFDLLSRVYKGTDGILRRMAHLMGGNATTRLLFELSNAARRYGNVNTKEQTILPLTENDLAKRSGLSRETVNRTMRKLKDAGLVTIDRNLIIIDDLARLERTLGSGL